MRSAIEAYLARLEGARISSLSLQFVRPLLAGSCLRIEGRSVGRKDSPLHMRILCRDDQGVLVAVAVMVGVVTAVEIGSTRSQLSLSRPIPAAYHVMLLWLSILID